MSELTDNTKKTDLITDNIKLIEGAPYPVDEQHAENDVAKINEPISDESKESATPKKIDSSHLFVVDGQECICVKETIHQKPKRH